MGLKQHKKVATLTPTQATDILSATCFALVTRLGYFLPLSSYALNVAAR